MISTWKQLKSQLLSSAMSWAQCESVVVPQGVQKELDYPMARPRACSGCRSLSLTLSLTRDRAHAGADRSSHISTEISHLCTWHCVVLKGLTPSAGGIYPPRYWITPSCVPEQCPMEDQVWSWLTALCSSVSQLDLGLLCSRSDLLQSLLLLFLATFCSLVPPFPG